MMVINSVFTIGVLFNRKDMKPPRNIGDDATYFNQELPKRGIFNIYYGTETYTGEVEPDGPTPIVKITF